MADKIVVLNKGRIEQVGSPLELYRRPANRFVAEFIGSPQMNIITGAPAAPFDAAAIGIRPEHLALSTSGAFGLNMRRYSGGHLIKPGRRHINQNQLGRALNLTEDPISTLFVFNSNPAAIAPRYAIGNSTEFPSRMNTMSPGVSPALRSPVPVPRTAFSSLP